MEIWQKRINSLSAETGSLGAKDSRCKFWIPAFAGMTVLLVQRIICGGRMFIDLILKKGLNLSYG
jgi:hypothetical protein